MTDIVFVLGFGSTWDNNEIRFALRSIEKHVKGFRNVYVVGECPSFLQGVIHVPFPDMSNAASVNTSQKLLRICQEVDLSNEFLFFNDDFFLLQDFEAATFPYYHRGDLLDYINQPRNGFYPVAMKNTVSALRRRKYATLHFGVHCPIRFKKKILPRVIEMFDWQIQYGLLTRCLYGNACQVDAHYRPDISINTNMTKAQIYWKITGHPFFTINDYGLNGDLKRVLAELYPNKSRFEK